MNSLPEGGPNAAMIEYWNGPGSERWTRYQEPHDALLAPLGAPAMDAAGVAPGRRVLDVGCGTGATTVEIARRVGPEGAVTGVDISAPMLANARARAAAQNGLSIAFERADVETHSFAPAAFDAAFSRYGVMFFRNPATAFRNVRDALRPDGRLGFVCWREARLNDWAMVTIRAAAQHLELPDPPGPEDPGPYSFSEPERVRRILTEAGFCDIALEPLDREVSLGANLEDAVINAQHIGPVANVVIDAPQAVRDRIAEDLRQALQPYATDDGVKVGSASWIVTARPA